MADTFDIGRQLVSLCREGKNLDAVNSLYAKDAVSVEAQGDEKMPARTQGIDAIRKKNKWFLENHEIHSAEVNGPWPHGDQFIVQMSMDITPHAGPMSGKRIHMDEAALYTVRDGKIVEEAFFYPPM